MRRRRISISRLLSITLMILLAAMISSCASQEAEVETAEYTGTLKNALEDSIIISNEDDNNIIQFTTSGDTEYDIGEEAELCTNDKIRVVYHEEGIQRVADTIVLKEHVHQDLSFEGHVSDVKKDSITVHENNLTVTFTKDSDTAVHGDLDKADEVIVTYIGDISEYPYATDIKVTSEAEKDDDLATVSGIISELADETLLLGIDSATAYRFTVAKNTKISAEDSKLSGEELKLKVGDSVKIIFAGDIEKDPVADTIIIVKKAQEQRRTINGSIKMVGKDFLTVDTGKRSYDIAVDKYTKYNGDKPAEGYKTEITYVGELGKDATAIIVYCVKKVPVPVKYTVRFVDGLGNTLKKQTVVEGKSASAPKDPSREGYSFKGWDQDFDEVTEDMTVTALWKKNDEPAPEEPVTSEGTIVSWVSGGDDVCVIEIDDVGEGEFSVDEDELDIPVGYFPEAGDIVEFSYMESDMSLRSIELISRPETEPADDEDAADDDEVSDDDASEEAAEPADEDAEPDEADDAADDEQADEDAAQEAQADVVIKAQGEIIAGDEENRSFKLKIDDQEVELKLDQSTNISSGYFPAKGDTVQVYYDKNSMTLQDIQLIKTADAGKDTDGADSDSGKDADGAEADVDGEDEDA